MNNNNNYPATIEKVEEMIRVSDYLAGFVYDHGIKDVFMLSGGGIMYLTDGLACHKKINVYCMHHEQAVSMAIEAYGRLTGKPGVGYFTTGPGATNALTGLAGAWLDSSPCLFISGQVKRREATFKMGIEGLRQVGVQEVNILPIVRSITKYAAFVDDPYDIRYHLEKAFYMVKEGRPGPVWLDIPLDVQGALIEPDRLKSFVPVQKAKKPRATDLKKVATALRKALRPVFLIGQGVRIAGGIKVLMDFVEKYRLPVVTTFLGIDIIDSSHLCYVGRIGIKGDRAGNLAVQNSDFLLVLGSSLPVAETGYEYSQFAREAEIVVVDIDISSHKKQTIAIDHLIEADVKDFLEGLASEMNNDSDLCIQKWLDTCLEWRQRYPVCLPEYAKRKDKISVYYFFDCLSAELGSSDVVVTDTGSGFYAGSQGTKIKSGMRYIASGGLVTMGYSLPASIGLSAALNKQRVICVTGDGSFQQNIQELQTVAHYRLPLKIFVLNNEGYHSIRFMQNRYFNDRFIGEGFDSGVSFPDTKRIARAYGIKFMRVAKTRNLKMALRRVLADSGPMLCEIMMPKDQLIVPSVASDRKEDGTMVSKPLEDMFPFLPREEFLKNMIIKPIAES